MSQLICSFLWRRCLLTTNLNTMMPQQFTTKKPLTLFSVYKVRLKGYCLSVFRAELGICNYGSSARRFEPSASFYVPLLRS